MILHTRVRHVTAFAAAASLVVMLLPAVAAAHSDLVSSAPAQGAVVASPYTGPIVLTFSEHLASGSKADLVDASGATVASATVDANAKTMTIAPTTPLAPGAYEIRWVSVADDGDLLRQPVIKFTVAAAPTPSPSAAPAATAQPSATAIATPTASPAPTPAPSAAGSETSANGSDVVVPIIVALIVLGAGAAYLLTRRNRPPTAT